MGDHAKSKGKRKERRGKEGRKGKILSCAIWSRAGGWKDDTRGRREPRKFNIWFFMRDKKNIAGDCCLFITCQTAAFYALLMVLLN
jgi:hypothetical protein